MQYSGKMVLIVDDSYLIIERVKDILSDIIKPERMLHAHTFTDGLEMLEENKPDILILDINLPDTNGIELLRLVKNKYPATIVIMLTNQGGDYYRQLCLKIGADHFIDKSKDFDLLPEIFISL